MRRSLIVLLASIPLAACNALSGGIYTNSQAQAMRDAEFAASKAYRDENAKKRQALIAAGAMGKWDRLEANAYNDYLDAKYPAVMDNITVEESNKPLYKSKPK